MFLFVKYLILNFCVFNNLKVILIGFICGLENEGIIFVVYAVIKFGCCGAVYSLREMFC